MKKLIIALIAVLMSTSAMSQNQGAEVSDWDVGNFSFTNLCTGENVRPFPGETIRLVMRETASARSFHGIAFASGHVNGYGVLSRRDTNIQVVIRDGVPEVVHLGGNAQGDCTAA